MSIEIYFLFVNITRRDFHFNPHFFFTTNDPIHIKPLKWLVFFWLVLHSLVFGTKSSTQTKRKAFMKVALVPSAKVINYFSLVRFVLCIPINNDRGTYMERTKKGIEADRFVLMEIDKGDIEFIIIFLLLLSSNAAIRIIPFFGGPIQFLWCLT